MSKLFEFATTRQEAKATGRTYFYANRECPIHHSRFHWAHNGKCMSCVSYHGEPVPVYGEKRKSLPPSGRPERMVGIKTTEGRA